MYDAVRRRSSENASEISRLIRSFRGGSLRPASHGFRALHPPLACPRNGAPPVPAVRARLAAELLLGTGVLSLRALPAVPRRARRRGGRGRSHREWECA